MKRMFMGILAVFFSGTAMAQTTQPSGDYHGGAAIVAPVSNNPLTVSAGVDLQTKYIFRGFTTTAQGLILQPYAQLSYTVYDKNDLTIAPYIGTWNNITSHPYAIKDGHTNNWRWWSETDLDAGVTSTYKNFTVGLNYIYYFYPNGSIGEDQEMGLTVGYDDSDFWQNHRVLPNIVTALNPHVAYYHEIKNTGGPNGGYLELGAEPTFKSFNVGKFSVTVSTPIVFGLTTDRYYTTNNGSTDTFGYFEAGLKASVPLNGLPGNCTLVGEVDYWHLNADNIRNLDSGKSDDVSARVGLSFKF